MAGFDPSIDPNEDPYFAWARAQQLAELQAQQQAPLVAPLAPPSLLDDAGRKGGGTSKPGGTQHIGPALSQGGNEAPQQVTPLPDPDPMADTDPRADMTSAELAARAKGADAISGAAPSADVASMVQLDQAPAEAGVQAPAPTSAGYYDWARQQAAEQPLPSMAERTMRDSAQAEIDAIGKMTPEEYIRWQGERAGHLRDMQTQQQADIDAENQRRAQQAFDAQQAAIAQAHEQSAEMMRRADELANTKIVPKKAGLADVVGILLGGMFSGGGPNMALAQFNRKVDTDMQAQHENIANGYRGLEMKRGAIADELARHGDLYRAQETYRLASYQTAINHLQTELQQYDPAGTTAMTIRNGIDQFALAKQKAADEANKQLVEDNLKRAQTAQAVASALKTQQETAGLKAKQSGVGAPAAAKILPVEYYTGLNLVAPPAPMSVEAYKDWLSLSKSGAESSKAQQDASSNAAATVVSKPHGDFAPVLDAKGQPVRIAADVAKELNEQNASAQNVVSDLNDVKRMLEEDPSTVDRKTWAEIQARIGQSLPAIAGYYKSKFSSREEEAIKDITNLDFDSYVRRLKDKGTAVASIDAIVDTVKRSVDTTNSTTLHTPVTGMLSDIGSAPKPKPTEVDQIMAKLATPSPNAGHPERLVEKYLTPDERRAMTPPSQITLAQQRAAENPGPAGAERAALLGRAQVFANATIKAHSGRYYLVDADGKDISGVAPVDTEAGGQTLLRRYRDAARAGLAKLAGDSEDQSVRESAGGAVLSNEAGEAGEALQDEAP